MTKEEAISCDRREPVWPSGKALGWSAEGPRFDSASALLPLQKGCGLWTQSSDFVCPSQLMNIKEALIAAILMQESF